MISLSEYSEFKVRRHNVCLLTPYSNATSLMTLDGKSFSVRGPFDWNEANTII